MPFRPKKIDTFTPSELEALEKLNLSGTSSPLSSPKKQQAAHAAATTIAKETFREGIQQQKVDIQKLEEKVEAMANGTK